MHWLNFWSAASFLRQIDAKCTGTCEVYVNVVLQHLTHLVLKTSGRLNSPAAWGVRDSRVSARHWICFCQHVHKVVSYQCRWVVLWRQTDKVKKREELHISLVVVDKVSSLGVSGDDDRVHFLLCSQSPAGKLTPASPSCLQTSGQCQETCTAGADKLVSGLFCSGGAGNWSLSRMCALC